MNLFQSSVLQKHLKTLDQNEAKKAWETFANFFHNPKIQENIRDAKEEEFQEGFLRELFVKVLGYTLKPSPQYNLVAEHKNVKNAKKADAAILEGNNVLAVIELKGTNTTDLDKVEAQAFGYKNNQRGCNYVIISNFEKLRLYIHNAVEHIEFDLFNLKEDEFKVLYLVLAYQYLTRDIPLKIKEDSVLQETKITKKLYADYSGFKRKLFENLVSQNPQYDKLLLFKKTQKLLDRFLFILFSEDCGLLPPNSITQIIDQWKLLIEEDERRPLYSRFKKYFGYINKGRKGKRFDIFGYNGGLFRNDELLDTVIIDDEVLQGDLEKLTEYDFQTEIDVNILGHIFEHSLNEIDEITAELEGRTIDKGKTKRKKDGVFYTPKYITKYIVDNTLGALCEAQKTALAIDDDEFWKGRKKKTKKGLINKLESYRKYLLSLTILDPACGSGAFLNEALDFLIAEHRYIDELNAKLFGASLILSDITKDILERNIYGVDINEESVHIAKLSLWLRTAQRGRTLTDLNNNIKCGNSLIDDVEVAGEKAFNWEKEFPKVFANGGFDVVIGNPPYGIFIDKSEEEYFRKNYPLTTYKINLYILFIEKMIYDFKGSIVHFIIPKSLLFNSFYESIRKSLLSKTSIHEIMTISDKVFEDAEVGDSLLLKFQPNDKFNKENPIQLISLNKFFDYYSNNGITNHLPQNYFLDQPNCEIVITSKNEIGIKRKIAAFKQIRHYYTLKNGLNTGNIKNILIDDTKSSSLHKPIVWGKDIQRYSLSWSGSYINYNENIADDLTLDDVQSKAGMKKQQRIDFALRSPEIFENKKLIVRKTGDSLISTFDYENFYYDTLVHGILEKDSIFSLKWLLGILNSRPATYFYRLLHDIKGKVFAKVSLTNLGDFPIPKQDENGIILMESCVDNMLLLNNQLQEIQAQFLDYLKAKYDLPKISKKLNRWYDLNAKGLLSELKKAKIILLGTEEFSLLGVFKEQRSKAQAIKAQINQTDKEIDKMVYALYGLTDEEIAIVENS